MTIRPIAATLTRSILIYATMCALLIGGLQAWISWQHARDEFESAIVEVGLTHVPLLSISIWDIEPDAIGRQLKQLTNQREIGFVRLTAKTGQVFESGDVRLRDGGDTRVFDIPQPRGVAVIAHLEVTANPLAMYRELAYAVGTSLIGYGVLTAVICLVTVLVLKRRLERPLRQVAGFAKTLTPDNLTTPLAIDRDHRPYRDEIDLMIDGFQVLQTGIDAHIKNLDHLVLERTHELELALKSIKHLSSIDTLTGCYNRRLFDERIAQELHRIERNGRALSIVFADVDHFKTINDTRGHGVGDQVLTEFARMLMSEVRADIDWVTRFGGEEFLITLPETDLEGAIQTAERIRQTVADASIATDGASVKISASFGVAQFVVGESTAAWLERADQALYQAKHTGRNRVCRAAVVS